jgi:hypothetical protein
LGDDRIRPNATSTELSDGAASGTNALFPSPEDERLIDLVSSLKKIEEYLIIRNIDNTEEGDLPFSEGASSFYIWLKETYRRRALRGQFVNSDYFSGEAAWDMLLDLASARIEGKRISVTSACIASGVPDTTALRWIAILENDSMVIREIDFTDRRRTFLRITDKAMALLNSYFDMIHSHPQTKRRVAKYVKL